MKDYTKIAIWCNKNNATIEDKGEYYECVAIPAPSLVELKQAKINEFKNKRDTLELAPINNFDADEKSIMRMNNAIIALGATNKIVEWTLADNTTTYVSADDLRDVIIHIGARSNELHETYRLLKEQVLQCTTCEEVEEIQWGNPENSKIEESSTDVVNNEESVLENTSSGDSVDTEVSNQENTDNIENKEV